MRFPFGRRKRRDDDLRQEIESHLEMAARERIDRGEAPQDAQHAAHREFGDVDLVRQVTRDQGGWIWFEQRLRDVRFSARLLRKHPGFAGIAMLTLALGIGANIAMCSVVYGVLLRSLPFPNAEQLMLVGPEWLGAVGALAPADFLDLRQENHVFSDMTAVGSAEFTLLGRERPEHLDGVIVTTEFFDTLGVQPQIGRGFLSDDGGPNGHRTVVLGGALWRGRFGANVAVLGTTVQLNDELYTVIGVAPPGFGFPEGSKLWVTPRYTVAEHPSYPNADPSTMRGSHYFNTYARLRRAVSTAQAQADVTAILTVWRRNHEVALLAAKSTI